MNYKGINFKYKMKFLKYFLFAGALIFGLAYMFTIAAPKASQIAKEELINKFFGVNNGTTVTKETDSIKSVKLGGYVSTNVDVVEALKNNFAREDIEVLSVGIPETKIPIIVNGKLAQIAINRNLKAKSVKFKMSGNIYHVYILFDRITGCVVDVINDERYTLNSEYEPLYQDSIFK